MAARFAGEGVSVTLITVMDVFRSMGIDPDPRDSWSVGAKMASAYAAEHGRQPPKDNRKKTSGAGTHCFALYPAEWAPRIEDAIRAICSEERQQGDLFEGGPT